MSPVAPQKPIFSIAGMRGIVGQTFTPTIVAHYIEAFASWALAQRGRARTVVLGGDSRPSRAWAEDIAIAVLRAHALDVAYIGLAPTPTIGLMVRELKAVGGIAITASHNPIEWNGLKFFHRKGEFLTPEHHAQFQGFLESTRPVEDEPLGKLERHEDALQRHLAALIDALPPAGKGSRRVKVVLDCCHGTASPFAPEIARAYGANAEILFGDPTRPFPRGPEPIAENLGPLCRAVKKAGADFGAAFDPDADRLALVDETGRAIGEERTLLLATDAWFAASKGLTNIAVNLSTSRAIDDLAAHYGVGVIRTRIGEAHVVAGMRSGNCAIGGEGNGGVIVPAIHPGRDAGTALALILRHLSDHKTTLSKWNAAFPDYAMVKDKVELGRISVADAIKKARKEFADGEQDVTDGLKVSFADRWVQLRPSGTEPILRIFAEAPTEEEARELTNRARKLLE